MSSKRALNDHKRKKHKCQENVSAKIFNCGHCKVSFTKSCNLLRHLRSQYESGSSYRCFCPTYFGELKSLTDHREQYHNDISSSTPNVDSSDLLDFTTEAVNSKFRIHRLKLDDSSVLEPFNYLILVREKIISFVIALLRETSNLKLGMSIAVRLENPMESEAVEAFFNSPMCRIACELTEDEYMQHIDALMTQLNVFATGGLGWVVEAMKQLEIKTAACGNVTGGSYKKTPPVLKLLKRSILHVVNKRDNFCFLYCIAAVIFSFVGRPHSPKIHKKIIKRLSFNPKLMPMPLSAIPMFEKRNRCSINVYQLENSKLVSVYHSKNRKGRHKIDLLRLLENKNSLYCLIIKHLKFDSFSLSLEIEAKERAKITILPKLLSTDS